MTSSDIFSSRELGVYFHTQDLEKVLSAHPQALVEWIRSTALETMMERSAEVFCELIYHGNYRKAKLFLQECSSYMGDENLGVYVLGLNGQTDMLIILALIQSCSALDLPSKPSEFLTAKATRDQRHFWVVDPRVLD